MENNSKRISIGQSSSSGPPHIDLRILVVDDDATTLAVVSSMLQICSYKVETAKNPLDALATLRLYNGLFDLVVTDLHMPFMNGFELTKQIAKEFKLPVILMSADDKENIMTEIIHFGIAHYISKPVTRDDLKDVWQFADRTRKGKSVMMIEEIEDPAPITRNNNIGGFDRPIQPYDGSFGDGSTEFGSLGLNNPGSYKRSGGDGDRDQGNGEGSSKKPCYRKEREHRIQRRKKSKKTKIVWTNSLHNRFLMAMRHLGYNTVPKKILDFMNVPGLTRENVASHLQKYRMFLKRVAENGILDATKMLTDRFMRSSFASGYPVDLMLDHARQMYPHLFRRNQHKHNYQNTLLPLPLPRLANPNSSSSFQLGPTTHGLALAQQPATRPVGLSTLLMDNRPSSAGSSITSPGLVSRTYSLLNSPNTLANNNSYSLARNPAPASNNPAGAGQIPTRFDSSAFLNGQSSFFSSAGASSSSSSAVGGGGSVSVLGGANSFGDTTDFLNQTSQVPIFTVPENNTELRVEDYASDLNDIAFEKNHDQRSAIDQVNTLTNQSNDFTAIQGRTQSMQFQSTERGLLNALDSFLPPIDPTIHIQPQSNEQTLRNALPSDNYLPGIRFQSQGNEQAVQNSGGLNNVVAGPAVQNPGFNDDNNNSAHPLSVDQGLLNSGNNFPLPSSSYLSAIAEQNTLLQTHKDDLFTDVFQSEGYVPILGETNLIQEYGGYGSALDPFQQIDLENVQSQLDWDEFMGTMLNDSPAPDLRE